jgi:hypothetical protein
MFMMSMDSDASLTEFGDAWSGQKMGNLQSLLKYVR